jgi:hypothetical protein
MLLKKLNWKAKVVFPICLFAYIVDETIGMPKVILYGFGLCCFLLWILGFAVPLVNHREPPKEIEDHLIER